MALDDSFRETERLDADEVYNLCRIRKPAEIYNLVGFGDPMTAWSERLAQEVGAKIIPRQVYKTTMYEQHDHRVAWVRRIQPHKDSVEDYHHIACDCLGEMENPEKDIEGIVECPAVLVALEHRARRVSEVLKAKSVLSYYGVPEGRLSLRDQTVIPIKSMVNFIMNYEQKHPEGWVANTVSGEHQVPLLAAILQVQPFSDPEKPDRWALQGVIEDMHHNGSLVLHNDGLTVTLPAAA
jgi:hypothetical protein